MIETITNFFKGLKVKKYGTTLEAATANPGDIRVQTTKEILKKCNSGKPVDLQDINHILIYELGLPLLKTSTFKFNDLLAANMAFNISSFIVKQEKVKSITGATFVLEEILLGGTLTIRMSANELYEIMKPICINKNNIDLS